MEKHLEQGEKNGEFFRVVRRRAVVGTALIFLGIFIVQMMVYAVVMLCVPFFFSGGAEGIGKGAVQFLEDEQFRYEIVEWIALLTSVCDIAWCGFLYLRSEWRTKVDYRAVFGTHHFLQIFLIGFCGCFVMIVVLTVLQQMFPAVFEDYQKGMDSFNTGSVKMFLYTLVLGPVAEELIFRGALFDRLYLAFPFYAANLVQAVLFAVYHRNLIQGIYAFFFGFLLGLLHQTGGSIWNNILAHILFNVTNFLVPVIYYRVAAVHGVLFAFLVLLVFFGFFYGVRSLVMEAGARELS